MIRAENISKNYVKKGRAIEALKPCSLSLPETGLVLITGETGSGKSTLLSLLSGLEKPTTGKSSAIKRTMRPSSSRMRA